MTTQTASVHVKASVQNRTALTGDDATLIVETWQWKRERIRVTTIIESATLYFTGEGNPEVQYTVLVHGPVQTPTTMRDHKGRTADKVYRRVSDVPMALLRHLVGEADMRLRLTSTLDAAIDTVVL